MSNPYYPPQQGYGNQDHRFNLPPVGHSQQHHDPRHTGRPTQASHSGGDGHAAISYAHHYQQPAQNNPPVTHVSRQSGPNTLEATYFAVGSARPKTNREIFVEKSALYEAARASYPLTDELREKIFHGQKAGFKCPIKHLFPHSKHACGVRVKMSLFQLQMHLLDQNEHAEIIRAILTRAGPEVWCTLVKGAYDLGHSGDLSVEDFNKGGQEVLNFYLQGPQRS